MPYTIVLADPSPSVQKAAQLVFAEPEFRLSVFEDSASLLGALDGIGPDALVVSLTLPGRAGYDLGRTLRSRKDLATVPLVGLRGTFECVDADKTAPPDYDEVLPKPFDSERLASVVRELIARKTGPSSLPEEPLWPGGPGAAGERGAAAPPPGAVSPSVEEIRAVVREEIVGMEREIEKRVRAGVLADLKESTTKP
ncbi:MAG: response regulator [Candidatus Aminicenantes bacterium]|nr:response regulator [Candidatus Aminicenantes bacterium]